jgi:hypothetical protein
MSVVNNNLLLTAPDAAVSQYQISRSLRFNSADSAYLDRTPTVAGNRTTWTWSGWVKGGQLGTTQDLFQGFVSGLTQDGISLTSSNTIDFYHISAPNVYNYRLVTSQVLRDPSAWFHLVATLDTTQATASSRARIYINGSEVLSFTTSTYPAQNFNGTINAAVGHQIGRNYQAVNYLSAYLADVHFIDGQALTPSSFTETNATTGQLVPKAYTGTYGTNGFRLNFSDNSAATAATLGADSSGVLNGNNGTLVNGPTYSSANGGSIVFDGTNDYVTIPNSSAFDLGTGDFTVESWVRITSLATYHAIFEARASAVAQNYVFGISNNGGTLRMDLLTAGGTDNRFATTTSVPLNTWAHIVWVRSGGVISYYVNTIKDATTKSYAGSVAPSFSTIYVGVIYDGFYFNGNISTIRVYKNKALSASEITQNYNALVGRFGGTSTGSIVTDGMVLNLDAGNTASYPGTGTTWTDISLRKNNWTPNNLSVTAGADNDSLTDTPTSYGTDTGAGGEVRGNYATLNPLASIGTVTNGNLDASLTGATATVLSTIPFDSSTTSGIYVECLLTTSTAGGPLIGIKRVNTYSTSYIGSQSTDYSIYPPNGDKYNNSTGSAYGAATSDGNVIGVAVKNGKIYFRNSSGWFNSANFTAETGFAFSGITGSYVFGASNSNATTVVLSWNFGQRPFAYAAPSGFKALCDTNIAEGSITTSGTFTGNASADGPFVWLNGVPTAMTINSNAVTFATHADKLANGFKVRSSSGSYNTAGSNTYSITTTGAKFKYARAQPNP